MSNADPVEGARELVARLRTSYGAQGLLLELNNEMRELIGKFTGMDFSNPADIYLAMRHLEEFLNRQNNRHADALEAALSAAPAPTERNLTDHQRAVEEAAGMPLDWGMANAAQVAAPARDGVRRLEAAMDMRMAVRQAFDVIAKANTVTVLSLAEMEQVVIKELQAAAAKEQADGLD